MMAFNFSPLATAIALCTLSQGTPTSEMIVIVAFSLFSVVRTADAISLSRLSRLEGLPTTFIAPSMVIITGRFVGATVVELDSGSGILIWTVLLVSIKNISNRNIISVREDILNSALTLLRFFTATFVNI